MALAIMRSISFLKANELAILSKIKKENPPPPYKTKCQGYFPADSPKYSCIVVIHEPDKSVGYYGADVSGPVFKKIAQKIYTDAPTVASIEKLNLKSKSVEREHQDYYEISQNYKSIMPNLKGMPAMDAIAILENMGLNVTIIGRGVVRKQSVKRGQKVTPQTNITLELS